MHLYNVLGLPKSCTHSDLKREYLCRAVKWHPDRYTTSPAPDHAMQHFSDLAHAYQVLSNPQTRKAYDDLVKVGGGSAGSSISVKIVSRLTTLRIRATTR